MDNIKELRLKYISEFKSNMITAESRKLVNCIVRHGFVVVMPSGLALKLETDGSGNVLSAEGACVWAATLLTKRAAANICENVVDGNGDHGRVLHLNDALDEYIESTRTLIERIEKLMEA